MTRGALPPQTTLPAAGTLVVEEPRFAIVTEWVIDAAISDGAFRLYSLLLRYGNGSGSRMPSRQTLARRLRRSVDAVDRAMRQLTEAGIVRVEHRRCGEQFLSNRYHVRTTAPADVAAADGSGRTSAATPEPPQPGAAETRLPGHHRALLVTVIEQISRSPPGSDSWPLTRDPKCRIRRWPGTDRCPSTEDSGARGRGTVYPNQRSTSNRGSRGAVSTV